LYQLLKLRYKQVIIKTRPKRQGHRAIKIRPNLENVCDGLIWLARQNPFLFLDMDNIDLVCSRIKELQNKLASLSVV
jgi:inactivated superfamily I helicase